LTDVAYNGVARDVGVHAGHAGEIRYLLHDRDNPPQADAIIAFALP